MNQDAREGDTGYYDTSIWKNPDTGENQWFLYRLDYPSGQQKMLYDFGSYGSGEVSVSNPFVQKDAVYVAGNDSLLAWLMDCDYTGPATIYDLEQGKICENIPIQAGDSGWPFVLTNDGRVLVNDHYNGGQPTYALISPEDYLAGSRDWTLFTEAET